MGRTFEQLSKLSVKAELFLAPEAPSTSEGGAGGSWGVPGETLPLAMEPLVSSVVPAEHWIAGDSTGYSRRADAWHGGLAKVGIQNKNRGRISANCQKWITTIDSADLTACSNSGGSSLVLHSLLTIQIPLLR